MIMRYSKELWAMPEFRQKMKSRTAGNSMRGKKHTQASKDKMSKSLKGKSASEKNYFWKGGRVKRSNGYIHIHSPNHPLKNKDNYVYEHRLVMEAKLGRYLEAWEIVHHVNGIKDDNRPENLELVTHQQNIQIDKLMRENERLKDVIKGLENA